MTELYHRGYPYEETCQLLKPVWDNNCTYYEMDFLDAVLTFRNMGIREALASENLIICILAIMDKRVGRRTLAKIKNEQKYEDYPEWVKQFYKLRFSVSMKDGIMHEKDSKIDGAAI